MGNRMFQLTLVLALLTAGCLRADDGPTREIPNGIQPEIVIAIPGLDAIVTLMELAQEANRLQSCSYTVIRDYKVFGKKPDITKAHVTAEVNFIPPDSKSYAIRLAGGSRLGVTLIRKVLDKESQLAKNSNLNYICRQNYDFRFIRAEEVAGHRRFVLEIFPKRKNVNLIQGNIVIDAGTYLILRVEGKPAVSPSWWLRDLSIILHYGDVGGMWLQTASEVAVTVRLLGRHTMTMVARDAVGTLAAGSRPPPAVRWGQRR